MTTAAPVQPPAHGFLLHQHHHSSYQDSNQPTAQPVVPKPQPSDPYYGHEETAKICSRFIRHCFNCPPETNSNPPLNGKPTESTISLPRFIAYAFHRTRLPSSVAFHSLFLLSRLKSRYPAASCAFGHRLFLTSYMLSSKVICDDTYSNKSWAIVGQGFYDLRDVNLMEREMIHYLSWDLTISGPDLATFTERVKGTYRKSMPKQPYIVIPDHSREKDPFGKGTIESKAPEPKKVSPTLPPLVPAIVEPKPTASVSPIDPPPSYSATFHNDGMLSPYTDSSSSGSSSRESSPPSPGPKTPPDEGSSAPSTPGGKPVRIDFIDPADIKHHHINSGPIRDDRPFGYVSRSAW